MHAHRLIPLLFLLTILLPFAHAAACSMNATLTLTNTHPAGYVYARLPSLPDVNLSITPHRAYLQRNEQAVFTLTLTAEASRSGSVSIPFYTSGVPLKRVTIPYTLTCPGEEGAKTVQQSEQNGWQYERFLLLILQLLVWLLLLPALAIWWKRRWVRREVLRILELRRRKPVPRWIIWLMLLIILTGFILLILVLAQPGISLITSMLPA